MKMATTSKSKSYCEQVLSKIDAKRFHESNQQKCIDCLKPRSNKNELVCKNSRGNEFYVLNY